MQKIKNKIIEKPVEMESISAQNKIVGANCVRQNSKGITLIALIITIIVMIILVGVTLNVALNGGLFDAAQKAANSTQIEVDRETLQAAALGSLGENAEVDFTKLDANLPDGFGGSNGTYTKDGNTYKVDKYGNVTLVEPETEKVISADDPEASYWKTDGQGTILYYEVPEGVEVPETLIIPCQIGDEKITKIDAFALCGVRLQRNDDGTLVLQDYGEGNMGPIILDEIDESGNPTPTGQTSEVKNIIISKGVESIEDGAFGYCTQIENIEIPNTIQNIGGSSFAYTSLKNITIPGSVTTIQRGIFVGCEVLEKVILEEGVITIEGQAFSQCTSIKEITIPSTVDNMGEHVFMYWNSDQTIYIKGKTEPPPETDDYSGVGWERSWDNTDANIVWDNE